MAEILAKGKGSLHGIDSSPSMIQSAAEIVKKTGATNCTFEGKGLSFQKIPSCNRQAEVNNAACDATELVNRPELQKAQFNKVFSNAAMHWILRPEEKRKAFFEGVKNSLAPGGTFVFEMGGLGNVAEMVCGIMGPVSRRIGLEKAMAINPWFFPDETWMRHMLEQEVGGFAVERIEREYRPTAADAGGVDGWVRLMGKQFFDAVPDAQREACIKEAVEVLEVVCKSPNGGYAYGYVRLRAVARKL